MIALGEVVDAVEDAEAAGRTVLAVVVVSASGEGPGPVGPRGWNRVHASTCLTGVQPEGTVLAAIGSLAEAMHSAAGESR